VSCDGEAVGVAATIAAKETSVDVHAVSTDELRK